MKSRAFVSLWVVAALLLPAAASAEKSYVAERFDSRIEILTGGALRVSETIVFRFEGGDFTSVYRTLPTRRTDGIEIVAAEMDGRVFPRGRETGQVEIDGGSDVRVRWRFRPVRDATHVFGLTYVARGAAWDDGASDIFFWAPLPRRHEYSIARARVDIRYPPSALPLAPPQVALARARQPEIASRADGVEFTVGELPKDGYLEVRLAFPHGTLLAAMPDWQTREQRVRRMAPVWIAGALCAAWSRFTAAQNDDLRAAGLLDEERLRVRRNLNRWSTALLLVASFGVMVPIVLRRTFGGWPFLVPLAVIAVAPVGYGMAARVSTLTAEGLRQASRWRGFAQHLKDVARGRADVRSNDDFEAYLPYAAAFGIGPIWLAHFKKRRDLHAPTWLQAALGDDGGMAALGAMFADGSAAGGGDGGGGGGAGGGGGSGAD
ncbi:MAG: DUF2207 family protein [Vicinamibacterales bacterium]